MLPRVSGYVLAGGESSRMQGSGLPGDKALLPFGDGTMLTHVLGNVSPVCTDVSILCGTPARAERLRFAGRTVVDATPGCGPLGGLEAALYGAAEEWLLLVPVDLPLLPSWALRVLVEQGTEDDEPGVACFAALERRQPLPVLLHRAARTVVVEALRRNERKLMPVLQRAAHALSSLGMCIVQAEDLASELDVSTWFTNVNTPDDYRTARDISSIGKRFSAGCI